MMPGDPAEPRELVGRLVRQVWVRWAREQPDPKPSWLRPWEELDDDQREADMRIGAALFDAGYQAASSGDDAGAPGQERLPDCSAVILVIPDGRVAVQLRDDKPGIAEPGKLALFGGALLDGEYLWEGARRELEEETTLTGYPLEYFASVASSVRPGKTVHVFIARDVRPQDMDVREGQGYRLLGADDLNDPLIAPTTRDVLRRYFAGVTP